MPCKLHLCVCVCHPPPEGKFPKDRVSIRSRFGINPIVFSVLYMNWQDNHYLIFNNKYHYSCPRSWGYLCLLHLLVQIRIQCCPIATYLFPTLWSVIPCGQTEISHGRGIYTMGIGKLGNFSTSLHFCFHQPGPSLQHWQFSLHQQTGNVGLFSTITAWISKENFQ